MLMPTTQAVLIISTLPRPLPFPMNLKPQLQPVPIQQPVWSPPLLLLLLSRRCSLNVHGHLAVVAVLKVKHHLVNHATYVQFNNKQGNNACLVNVKSGAQWAPQDTLQCFECYRTDCGRFQPSSPQPQIRGSQGGNSVHIGNWNHRFHTNDCHCNWSWSSWSLGIQEFTGHWINPPSLQEELFASQSWRGWRLWCD